MLNFYKNQIREEQILVFQGSILFTPHGSPKKKGGNWLQT